ncbi:MAG: hypothetical protein JWP75_528 [Frondihabitans sp.]|nr:hypothetical protein [Frondihabitans sp.]
MILGGLHESAQDFELLTAQLLLVGFRVTIFDDVSVDVEAGRLGVRLALEAAGSSEPLVLLGSDLGAVLVAGLVADSEVTISAVVIGNLVTPTSRPSTVTVADFAGFEETSTGLLPRDARLPVGIRLPDAHDIGVPALVFHGDADDVTEVSDAVSWASQLPFGSLRLVPNGDHHVLTGEARRVIAASVVLFLERQRAGKSVLVDGFASTELRRR